MEFAFKESDEALRAEVRSFLKEQLGSAGSTGGGLGARSDDDFERALHFNQELAKRSWIAPAWPKEYGGREGPEPVRYGDYEKNGIAVDF